MGKDTFKAVFGLILFIFGILSIMSGILSLALISLFTPIVNGDNLCVPAYILVYMIIGALTLLGLNLFLRNETKILKILFGLLGIVIIIADAILAVLLAVGSVTVSGPFGLPLVVLGWIFFMGLGTALISHGFSINLFPWVDKSFNMVKKIKVIK